MAGSNTTIRLPCSSLSRYARRARPGSRRESVRRPPWPWSDGWDLVGLELPRGRIDRADQLGVAGEMSVDPHPSVRRDGETVRVHPHVVHLPGGVGREHGELLGRAEHRPHPPQRVPIDGPRIGLLDRDRNLRRGAAGGIDAVKHVVNIPVTSTRPSGSTTTSWGRSCGSGIGYSVIAGLGRSRRRRGRPPGRPAGAAPARPRSPWDRDRPR